MHKATTMACKTITMKSKAATENEMHMTLPSHKMTTKRAETTIKRLKNKQKNGG